MQMTAAMNQIRIIDESEVSSHASRFVYTTSGGFWVGGVLPRDHGFVKRVNKDRRLSCRRVCR